MKHSHLSIHALFPIPKDGIRLFFIFFMTILSFAAPLAHSAGSVNLLLSASQDIDYDYPGEVRELESEYGAGLVFDWYFGGQGSLAIDFYSLGGMEEVRAVRADSTYVGTLNDDYTALLFGYRYHFNHFSIGAGIASVGNSVSYAEEETSSRGFISRTIQLNYESALTPAFTLGYRYAWQSGFTLGGHIFYSLPTDLDIEEGCLNNICIALAADPDFTIKDLTLNMVGLTIGYSWE